MLRKAFSIVLVLVMTASAVVPVLAEEDAACYEGGQHEWTEWEVDWPASCGYEGIEHRECKKCYTIEDREISPSGKHRWTSWEVMQEPSCVEKGEYFRFCEECYEQQYKSVPVNGRHAWESWGVITPATIYKKGLKGRNCEFCGKYQTAKVAKLKPFAKFAKKTYTLGRGKSMTMKASYARGDKIKSWKSSKRKVAAINKKGKIVGKRYGTTKITVTMKSGKKATCVVKVVKPSKKVYWTPLGGVYHKSKNCKTLKKSKVIKSGTIKQSKKPRVCKVCGK